MSFLETAISRAYIYRPWHLAIVCTEVTTQKLLEKETFSYRALRYSPSTGPLSFLPHVVNKELLWTVYENELLDYFHIVTTFYVDEWWMASPWHWCLILSMQSCNHWPSGTFTDALSYSKLLFISTSSYVMLHVVRYILWLSVSRTKSECPQMFQTQAFGRCALRHSAGKQMKGVTDALLIQGIVAGSRQMYLNLLSLLLEAGPCCMCFDPRIGKSRRFHENKRCPLWAKQAWSRAKKKSRTWFSSLVLQSFYYWAFLGYRTNNEMIQWMNY